jgi:hypothetical protein
MKPRVKLRSLALAMSVAVVPGRYDKARLQQPGFLIPPLAATLLR